MKNVGIGGHYLMEEHTLEHMKNNYLPSKILNKDAWETWMANGSKDSLEKASEIVEAIFAKGVCEELVIEESKAKEIDYIAKTAMEIVNLIKENPKAVIGLATGNTPKGMYKVLGEMYKKNEVDFSGVITLNLDEYLGEEPENPGSCKSYLKEGFYDYVNLKQKNIYHLNSQPKD